MSEPVCPSSNPGAGVSAQKSYLELKNLSKVKTIRLSMLSHASHLFSLRYGIFNNSNTTSKKTYMAFTMCQAFFLLFYTVIHLIPRATLKGGALGYPVSRIGKQATWGA